MPWVMKHSGLGFSVSVVIVYITYIINLCADAQSQKKPSCIFSVTRVTGVVSHPIYYMIGWLILLTKSTGSGCTKT